MNKKIISIKDLGDCKAFLSNLDNSSFILNVTINNDNYDTIKYLIKHSQSIKECVEVINLNLPYEMIPKDDFEAIYNLGVMLPKTRCNVIVNHRYIEDDRFIDKTGSVMWSLPTIIKANNHLKLMLIYTTMFQQLPNIIYLLQGAHGFLMTNFFRVYFLICLKLCVWDILR